MTCQSFTFQDSPTCMENILSMNFDEWLTIEMFFLRANHFFGGSFAYSFCQTLSCNAVPCGQKSVVYGLTRHAVRVLPVNLPSPDNDVQHTHIHKTFLNNTMIIYNPNIGDYSMIFYKITHIYAHMYAHSQLIGSQKGWNCINPMRCQYSCQSFIRTPTNTLH